MIGIYLLAVISGSDAALRHAQEHPRGDHRRHLWWTQRRDAGGDRGLSMPPVSGLAQFQGRQGRRVLLGLFWPAALVFCVTWLATAALSRYSSLSVLVASFVTPIFLWWFGH
jgi:hypothetical protein